MTQERPLIVKNVGMACQKVCKQGMDNIQTKVNIHRHIPAPFSHYFLTVL